MRVLVGSTNPVKLDATRAAFSRYFEDVQVSGHDVDPGVPEQPFGLEGWIGALGRTRALAGLGAEVGADGYYVGIEGAVQEQGSNWFALGCICIADTAGRRGYGASPLFQLPASVIEALRSGEELGDVIDRVTGTIGSKREGGAIGHFTRGRVDRRALYMAGLEVALAPFLHEEAFFGADGDCAAEEIPPLDGVRETSLYVDDLDRSESFYRGLFGVRLLVGDARMRALALPEGQVLLLFLKGASANMGRDGPIPGHDGAGTTHVAFGAPRGHLQAWERRLADRGIPVVSRISWDRGGDSIYFRDPDEHLVELVTRGCWSTY